MNASDGRPSRLAALLEGLRSRGVRAEPLLYALVAGICTLAVACLFYSSMRLQTLFSSMSGEHFAAQIHSLGEWSAPLDDVFIHFDFARATARGFPFQWSEGNGYSSGGTSLLYPFVLAFGYWVGFREMDLMVWAGLVACVCVFGTLLASRRLFQDLPRWTSYLAPPFLLGVGALDWTLFSGMEVALLLALFAGAMIAWDDLRRAPATARLWPLATVLGLWGLGMVATRPEAATSVFVLSVSAAWSAWRRRGFRPALAVLAASAVPGALVIVGHGVANEILTGSSTAAGALVKLEMYHPFLSSQQILDAWVFHMKYQVLRVTQYHLTDTPGYGWILWGLAFASLLSRKTRAYGLMLWACATLWVVTVALNGQVRWQNERYTMPALAWLLLAAALGTAVLVSQVTARGGRGKLLRGLSAAVTAGAVLLFAIHQLPRFRGQVWFFGRASRNIRDQHIRTGRVLAKALVPKPRRVLVGDAGAIPYSSDLPALDIIGLGGYAGYPFAEATQLSVAAAVELIERMPPSQRPDVMAIYPSWWGTFPLWFGKRKLFEVPVHGNVICGGPIKVVYQADWSPLWGSARPADLDANERIVDELDFADLISEKEHAYTRSVPKSGYVHMKLLPDLRQPELDLWDAGRLVQGNVVERFSLGGFAAGKPVRLVFRAAPTEKARFAVVVNGWRAGVVALKPSDGWQEPSLKLPGNRVAPTLSIELLPLEGERVDYHLWGLQTR